METHRTNRALAFIISLLLPIVSLFYGIKDFNSKAGRMCLILFITFFGYQLIYHVEGTAFGSGADCARYAVLFSQSASQSGISFLEFFSQLDSHDSIDYFNPLLIYAISRVTSNIHLYFMIFAFIFALFYVNNLYAIMKYCNGEHDRIWKLLFFVTSFILSVHDFGGIRMPLAFQVFLFGVFKYVFQNNKFGLLFVLLTVLIHYSMFIFVLAFLIFLIIPKSSVKAFLVFFIIAHLLESIDIPFVQRLFMLLPGGVEERLNIYTNEANLEQFAEGGRFYLGVMNLWGRLDSIVLRIYIPISMILIYTKRAFLTKDEEYLFKLSLYIYGCALILSNLPSGYRFLLPSSMICFATTTIIYSNNEKIKNNLYRLTCLTIPLLVVFLLHRFRFVLNEVGFSVFYTNYITMFFVEDNVPILDAIKGIL